ncbi:hypothetical protein N7478_004929 [Penicillium angulare]|uniref:uncharacterized protein n=1 Tax=Penicillium angulare TaxID=116970 RepID=UPI00254218C0|nr:uncharacterized protein N7478_004929 [Penicillium angulare]KAJ5279557.1 hypothetical protein N7478_004929 [Penicillium angulare]
MLLSKGFCYLLPLQAAMALASMQSELDVNAKCRKALEIATSADVSILEELELPEAQPQLDEASPVAVYQGVGINDALSVTITESSSGQDALEDIAAQKMDIGAAGLTAPVVECVARPESNSKHLNASGYFQ